MATASEPRAGGRSAPFSTAQNRTSRGQRGSVLRPQAVPPRGYNGLSAGGLWGVQKNHKKGVDTLRARITGFMVSLVMDVMKPIPRVRPGRFVPAASSRPLRPGRFVPAASSRPLRWPAGRMGRPGTWGRNESPACAGGIAASASRIPQPFTSFVLWPRGSCTGSKHRAGRAAGVTAPTVACLGGRSSWAAGPAAPKTSSGRQGDFFRRPFSGSRFPGHWPPVGRDTKSLRRPPRSNRSGWLEEAR